MNKPFFYCLCLLLLIQITYLINASDLYWTLVASVAIVFTILIGIFYCIDIRTTSKSARTDET
jgi:hypothetical protein